METADLLRDTFRGSDLRARIAAADFVVLAVGAPEPTTPILIARLEESLQSSNAQGEGDYHLVLRVGAAHLYAPRAALLHRRAAGRGAPPSGIGARLR